VPTILPASLPNAVERLYLQTPVPLDSTVLLVVGGLVLLLILVLVLFWRMSRQQHAVSPAPTEKPGEPPLQIVAPPTPPLPVTSSLEFLAESGQRISFELDKPTVSIGRAAGNDIVLAAPILNVDTVSQQHARLRRDQDGYIVRDLNSKNGLAVNGRQTIENLLQDGDRLQFGEAEAIFHQPAGGAA
jgi:pSer/pThr/pTyr-binding forkhead associated (FHA) protein